MALTFGGPYNGPAQSHRQLRSREVSGAVLAQGNLRMPKLLCGMRPVFVFGQDCGHICNTASMLCDKLIV